MQWSGPISTHQDEWNKLKYDIIVPSAPATPTTPVEFGKPVPAAKPVEGEWKIERID
jgi:hypothetical protein